MAKRSTPNKQGSRAWAVPASVLNSLCAVSNRVIIHARLIKIFTHSSACWLTTFMTHFNLFTNSHWSTSTLGKDICDIRREIELCGWSRSPNEISLKNRSCIIWTPFRLVALIWRRFHTELPRHHLADPRVAYSDSHLIRLMTLCRVQHMVLAWALEKKNYTEHPQEFRCKPPPIQPLPPPSNTRRYLAPFIKYTV